MGLVMVGYILVTTADNSQEASQHFSIKLTHLTQNSSLGHSYHNDCLQLVFLRVVSQFENVYVVLVNLLDLVPGLSLDVEVLIHGHGGDSRLHSSVELGLPLISRAQGLHVTLNSSLYRSLPGGELPDPILLLEGLLLLNLLLGRSPDYIIIHLPLLTVFNFDFSLRHTHRLRLILAVIFRLVKQDFALELIKLTVAYHLDAVLKLFKARVLLLNAQLKVNQFLNDSLLHRLAQVFRLVVVGIGLSLGHYDGLLLVTSFYITLVLVFRGYSLSGRTLFVSIFKIKY